MEACRTEDPLFRQLAATETHIAFNNCITDTEQLNALSFEYIYNGGGVAVGDFNNDGFQDLYFTGNQVSSKLYLNKGKKISFEDITESSHTTTKAWCTGVTVVDINQDGWQDIYVCVAGVVEDTTQRANLLFENQGLDKNGIPVFKEKAAQYGLNDMGYSTQAAFFDYDRDGDLDCYVLTNALEKNNRNALRPKRLNGEAPSNDRLYRNDGEQFVNVSRQAGILTEGYGLGLAISDLNGDGWEDIYCSNDFLSNDLVWINNQKGGFTNQSARYLKHQTHNGMGVDIADINNDARPDIMVVDMLPETNERQKMMLSGSNHDRMQLDLKLGYQPQFMRNTLQLNRGEMRTDSGKSFLFSDISQFSGVEKTDWSWAPLFADYDNDGQRDLMITNGYRRDVTNMDFTAYLASQHETDMFGGGAQESSSEVFKKLKTLPNIKLSNYAYRNRGDLTFEDVTKTWGLSQPSYSNGAVYADLDNDGDLDYVVNNIDDTAFCFENTANNLPKSNNWLRVKLSGLPRNRDAIGAKIKLYTKGQVQYRECNPTRGYVSSVELVQHFGLGAHTTIDSMVVFWPDGTKQTEKISKVNGLLSVSYKASQAKPFSKIFEANTATPEFEPVAAKAVGLDFRHIENEYNDFNRTPILPHKFSRVSPSMAVGDVNEDGLDDLFVAGDVGQTARIFIQHAKGTFAPVALAGSEKHEAAAAVFFDADRDGDADLYVVSGGSHQEETSDLYQDQLYINHGKGKFELLKNAIPPTDFSGSSVSVGDFDHDGDLDILRGSRLIAGQYPLSPQSYLFVNESVKSISFQNKTAALAPALTQAGLVTSLAWVDIDQDRMLDIVWVGEWMAPSVVYQKKGKFGSPERLVADTEGWWQSMLIKDVDADGDSDIVLGNTGLNTKYKPSIEQPVRMYAKDFDGNGRMDPVMSFYLQNQEVPVVNRDLLLLQIPGLKKYFQSYELYAQTKMKDVFNKKDLESAYQLQAKEFRSGWIENKGKRQYSFHPFEGEAQFSVINTLLSFDNNLLLLGNSHAPETVSGWYDAGIGTLLQNQGKGKWQTSINSGLCVDKEARCAVEVRREKDVLLVIGNVNNDLQVYKRKIKTK